jgi:hypothetical protein
MRPPPIEAALLLRRPDLLEGHLINNHLPTAKQIFKDMVSACLSAKWCNLARLSQARGARSSHPLDEPECPDHAESEKENSSTRKERRCKLCSHHILQEG